MSTAYLLTGGNLGNRSAYLQEACRMIQITCGKIVHYSAIYETEAWGLTEQPSFYNQALMVDTSLTPESFMRQLLAIEAQMGRKRTVKMGPRIIDLDILLFDNEVVSSALLTLPHPALPFRRFALLPLSEIAPWLVHPLLHKNIQQLLEECNDVSDVQKKSLPAN